MRKISTKTCHAERLFYIYIYIYAEDKFSKGQSIRPNKSVYFLNASYFG